MGAGESIRAALAAVAAAVPGSDKAVSLVQETQTGDDPATGYRGTTTTTTLVELGTACEVRNLSVERAVALTGHYQAGDREFRLPAASVTEAQLRAKGAAIRYGTTTLDIRRVDGEVVFGTVVEWRVVARERGGAPSV